MKKEGFYKFCDDYVAQSIINKGELWLGSLDYYRLMELVWNRNIGDRDEGLSVYNVSLSSDVPGDRDVIAEKGYVRSLDGEESDIQIRTVEKVWDSSFIFSIAFGDFDALYAELSVTRDGIPGYQSALEVTDVEELQRRIHNATVLEPRALEGMKVADLGFEYNYDFVRYGTPVVQDGSYIIKPGTDAFFKSSFFEKQREYRIRVQHPVARTTKHLVIRLPGDSNDVFKSVIEKRPLPEFKPRIRSLRRLYDAYERLSRRLERQYKKRFSYDDRAMALNVREIWQAKQPVLAEFYLEYLQRRVAQTYWHGQKTLERDFSFELKLLNADPGIVMGHIHAMEFRDPERYDAR